MLRFWGYFEGFFLTHFKSQKCINLGYVTLGQGKTHSELPEINYANEAAYFLWSLRLCIESLAVPIMKFFVLAERTENFRWGNTLRKKRIKWTVCSKNGPEVCLSITCLVAVSRNSLVQTQHLRVENFFASDPVNEGWNQPRMVVTWNWVALGRKKVARSKVTGPQRASDVCSMKNIAFLTRSIIKCKYLAQRIASNNGRVFHAVLEYHVTYPPITIVGSIQTDKHTSENHADLYTLVLYTCVIFQNWTFFFLQIAMLGAQIVALHPNTSKTT